MQVSNRPIVSHDLLKLTLYVVAVLLGGALLSPWLVSGGQWLLATFNPSNTEPPSGLLKEIHKADFSRYFSRATQICAVLLLFPRFLHFLCFGLLRCGSGCLSGGATDGDESRMRH